MPNRGPFPTQDSEFNTYIQTAIAWLVSDLAQCVIAWLGRRQFKLYKKLLAFVQQGTLNNFKEIFSIYHYENINIIIKGLVLECCSFYWFLFSSLRLKYFINFNIGFTLADVWFHHLVGDEADKTAHCEHKYIYRC